MNMNKPDVKIIDVCDAPKFIPVVARWHHAEWAHLNPGQTLAARINKMSAYLKVSVDALGSESFTPKLFVALNGEGFPVGTAALDLHDMDNQPMLSPWLASVFVLPEYRQKGIATALVKYGVKVAVDDMGVKQIHLFTPNHRSFYERLGWVHSQRLSYYGELVDLMYYQ